MYHEFIIASTMLISEREAAPLFGYDAGDRWVLSEIAGVRDSLRHYQRRVRDNATCFGLRVREIGRADASFSYLNGATQPTTAATTLAFKDQRSTRGLSYVVKEDYTESERALG